MLLFLSLAYDVSVDYPGPYAHPMVVLDASDYRLRTFADAGLTYGYVNIDATSFNASSSGVLVPMVVHTLTLEQSNTTIANVTVDYANCSVDTTLGGYVAAHPGGSGPEPATGSAEVLDMNLTYRTYRSTYTGETEVVLYLYPVKYVPDSNRTIVCTLMNVSVWNETRAEQPLVEVLPSAPSYVGSGEEFSLLTSVRNTGELNATGFTLGVSIPAGLTVVDDSSCNLTSGHIFTHSMNSSYCLVRAPSAGSDTDYTFQLAYDYAEGDAGEENVTVTVYPMGRIRVNKTEEVYVWENGTATVHIDLENVGEHEAVNVTVSEGVYPYMNVTGVSENGTYDGGNNTLTWSFPTLAVGGTLALNYTLFMVDDTLPIHAFVQTSVSFLDQRNTTRENATANVVAYGTSAVRATVYRDFGTNYTYDDARVYLDFDDGNRTSLSVTGDDGHAYFGTNVTEYTVIVDDIYEHELGTFTTVLNQTTYTSVAIPYTNLTVDVRLQTSEANFTPDEVSIGLLRTDDVDANLTAATTTGTRLLEVPTNDYTINASLLNVDHLANVTLTQGDRTEYVLIDATNATFRVVRGYGDNSTVVNATATVRDEDGGRLAWNDTSLEYGYSGRTNSSGEVHWLLPLGDYSVLVEYDEHGYNSFVTNVTLSSTSPTLVNLTSPMPNVTFLVVLDSYLGNATVPNATVNLYRDEGDDVVVDLNATMDAYGAASFGGLNVSLYEVRVWYNYTTPYVYHRNVTLLTTNRTLPIGGSYLAFSVVLNATTSQVGGQGAVIELIEKTENIIVNETWTTDIYGNATMLVPHNNYTATVTYKNHTYSVDLDLDDQHESYVLELNASLVRINLRFVIPERDYYADAIYLSIRRRENNYTVFNTTLRSDVTGYIETHLLVDNYTIIVEGLPETYTYDLNITSRNETLVQGAGLVRVRSDAGTMLHELGFPSCLLQGDVWFTLGGANTTLADQTDILAYNAASGYNETARFVEEQNYTLALPVGEYSVNVSYFDIPVLTWAFTCVENETVDHGYSFDVANVTFAAVFDGANVTANATLWTDGGATESNFTLLTPRFRLTPVLDGYAAKVRYILREAFEYALDVTAGTTYVEWVIPDITVNGTISLDLLNGTTYPASGAIVRFVETYQGEESVAMEVACNASGFYNATLPQTNYTVRAYFGSIDPVGGAANTTTTLDLAFNATLLNLTTYLDTGAIAGNVYVSTVTRFLQNDTYPSWGVNTTTSPSTGSAWVAVPRGNYSLGTGYLAFPEYSTEAEIDGTVQNITVAIPSGQLAVRAEYDNGTVLADRTVRVYDWSTGSLSATGSTNATGDWAIYAPAGRHLVQTQTNGIRAWREQVTLSYNETENRTILPYGVAIEYFGDYYGSSYDGSGEDLDEDGIEDLLADYATSPTWEISFMWANDKYLNWTVNATTSDMRVEHGAAWVNATEGALVRDDETCVTGDDESGVSLQTCYIEQAQNTSRVYRVVIEAQTYGADFAGYEGVTFIDYRTYVIDDTKAPELSFDTPLNGTFVSGDAFLNGSIDEYNPDSVLLFIDDLPNMTWPPSYFDTTLYDDGLHNVTLWINDTSGNTDMVTRWLWFDNTDPNATSPSASPNATRFMVETDLTGTCIDVYGLHWANVTASFNGTSRVYAQQCDNAISCEVDLSWYPMLGTGWYNITLACEDRVGLTDTRTLPLFVGTHISLSSGLWGVTD